MDKQTLDLLARFCAHQRHAFDIRAWLSQRVFDTKVLAVAAKFLSMTSWYGHEEELTQICERLHAGVVTREWFDQEAAAIGFDMGNFSATTRYRFAKISADSENL